MLESLAFVSYRRDDTAPFALALKSELEKRLATWKRSEVKSAWPRNPAASPSRKVYLVDRPGSVQTTVALGNIAIDRRSPDYLPMVVMNDIIGGGASSRLFLNLREEKGYTFNSYDKVKLYEVPVDFAVRQKVFELPASDATVYDSVNKDNGNAVVVALSEVVKGKREDMPKEQIDIMRSQLARQNAMAEYAAYQSKLVSDSKIRVY